MAFIQVLDANGVIQNLQTTVAGINNSPWHVVSDGTNPVAVKPASTAAVVGDIALVVAISPNNTVAVTQSTSPWVNNITQVGGSAVTLGQKVMASSIPVTIASDQSLTPPSLTPASPGFNTVGTSSGLALAANSNRKGLVLTNTNSGSNTISLGFGVAAVLDSGITLNGGQSYIMTERTFYTGTINAIASAGSSNLAIQEYS